MWILWGSGVRCNSGASCYDISTKGEARLMNSVTYNCSSHVRQIAGNPYLRIFIGLQVLQISVEAPFMFR